ncbi:MAG: carbohydrate ABC transporter permease, partial [Clostridia bacterium]|nr:carbohydrate ABC transporter permease [Clostridia bacterium]
MKNFRALNKSSKVNRSKLGTVLLFIILLVFSCVMAFPMILIIANAFKPQDELWVFPPKLIPNHPTLENFRNMFTVMSSSQVPFLRYIFNTVFITAIGTVGHIILSSMCAFPLAKKKFPGRNVIFRIIVLALMFNATVTAVPNFLTMSWFHWINTYLALIVPAFGAPIGLYLMKQFIEQLPDSLLEAARIDGAGQWHSFWKIVMPNVKA